MKNILITGGAGFIGSNLALRLIEKGYNITVLDNLSPQIHGENPEKTSPLYLSIKDKVRFVKGTVTSKDDWEKALKDQDVVVHYAAETGTGQSMYEVQKYVDVNISGTALMLDLLVNGSYGVKKVVVASSRSIYGEGKYISKELGEVYPTQRSAEYMDQGDFEVKYLNSSELTLVGTDEESKIHPSSVYGITKQNQEQMVMTVCPSVGIVGVALRYQNVYGPGQSLKNPYTGILSIFSTQIKNGNEINIFEDGKESRDFVFIDDVVEATILAIEKEEANNQVFNVGTGVATDVMTVANELVKNYGIQVPIRISGNYRLGDIRHNYADLTKINTLLGFEPKVSFEEGLKKFTEWVNTQEVEEDRYEKSIEEMKVKGLYK
ncbi:NAD-dependent epimerase/dehydratase family protein [Riemerella anatipestifer]|uniref:NAD-dependent epimerase/dehydratase family protein n=1 Tax=Riemerella anatipestifer TaxID=34085 RepID=A0AAP6LN57_RIEAN|nr:NAD-dependent epimerase/dehydratase family protein [Riemerella anatipestifer]MBT0573012.1 NAD-dependent epimerase/dehydratase family protein [Riemerella anatipestifer]MCU7573707.1 NAD-dependent epimerase/dehydratase family protein [Riemerella anatipestifer]MCU7594867.1 NAD-dependent epimerase/dehydratase family protein [Riemerella anatipestifer]MCW0486120.1 NAD-dependent epimerase/dehydratase family protein [Riemerella anatipestifer]MCW0489198.1 NAD-dependent epimerase/dehydratase family pr